MPCSKSADEVLRAESHLSHALEQYRRVLEKDEGALCCCAVHAAPWLVLGRNLKPFAATPRERTPLSAADSCPPGRPPSHRAPLFSSALPAAGCISAANGIGCVLAEMGDINSAKEVFLQVCFSAAQQRLSGCGSAGRSLARRLQLACAPSRC